jgi:four helix bundle protein
MKKMYRGYRDLKVYRMSYSLAMDIFDETKSFPVEERYSLTDQIRRSSRSIAANLSEAWKRRLYRKMFVSRIIDSASEAGETEVWLDFSRDCGYLSEETHQRFMVEYDEVNRMLFAMVHKPDRFLLRE